MVIWFLTREHLLKVCLVESLCLHQKQYIIKLSHCLRAEALRASLRVWLVVYLTVSVLIDNPNPGALTLEPLNHHHFELA